MSKNKLNKQQRRHREQFEQFEEPEPPKPEPFLRIVAKVTPLECQVCHMWMDPKAETCPCCSHPMK
jgi:hypothetical protein